MASNAIGINLGTQAYINFDQTGTVNTQVIDLRQGTVTLTNPTGTTVTVDHGTVTLSNPTGTTVQFNNGTIDLVKAGTITRVEGGTITVSNPTGTTVQFNNGTVDLLKAGTITKLEGGTLGLITRVGNVGTIEVGTISAMPQVSVGTIPNIPGGTLGLVTTVTTVSNVTNGSIRVTAGTEVITSGTITSVTDVANLAKGTVTRLEGGTLGVVSSVTDIANLAKGTVTRIEGGTINRINTIGTLEVGTVSVTAQIGTINVGTINTGTINTGTIDLMKAGTITRVEQGSINVTAGTVIVTNGTIGAITPSTGQLNLGKMDDSEWSSNSVGVMGLGLRNDNNTDKASVNLYYTPFSTDSTGAQKIIGKVAHDVASSGNPINIGGFAKAAAPSNVSADGDIVNAWFLLNGAQAVNLTAAGALLPGDATNGLDVDLTRGTVTRLEQGSINVTAGTITAGSIIVTNGTISHGTIDAGTVRINPIPTVHTQVFGTTTTGTIGTLVAAPSAGSSILLHSLDVNLQSGTAEVLVSYGLAATGNGVITRGNYTAGGGISKNPTYPIGGLTTGSALTYNILSGSGTVSYSIAYQVAIP